eukprot:TRINITY_DN4808_c0_g1_i1.p1 TRINITY_DN4808_c0_g1~~TRINITY_DN4808_c0_g1_i1.p1  ORF type:complete len:126 (-),score=0.39 TRINITY_DN4808_c0_g1_i1:61-438(-)
MNSNHTHKVLILLLLVIIVAVHAYYVWRGPSTVIVQTYTSIFGEVNCVSTPTTEDRYIIGECTKEKSGEFNVYRKYTGCNSKQTSYIECPGDDINCSSNRCYARNGPTNKCKSVYFFATITRCGT